MQACQRVGFGSDLPGSKYGSDKDQRTGDNVLSMGLDSSHVRPDKR